MSGRIKLLNYIFLIIFTGCINYSTTKTEAAIFEEKKDLPFHVKIKKVVGASGNDKKTEEIRSLIENIFLDLRKGNSTVLMENIDKEKGIYIDYDAARDYNVFNSELKDSKSFSYAVLFDSKQLNNITKDTNQKSLRYLLLHNSNVFIEIFFEGKGDRAEVKFYLDETPSESFRFNNAVLLLINNKWKIWQLF
jgi:hypothetical protein